MDMNMEMLFPSNLKEAAGFGMVGFSQGMVNS